MKSYVCNRIEIRERCNDINGLPPLRSNLGLNAPQLPIPLDSYEPSPIRPETRPPIWVFQRFGGQKPLINSDLALLEGGRVIGHKSGQLKYLSHLLEQYRYFTRISNISPLDRS